MWNSRVLELLYASGLLTAIISSPEIVMKLHLDEELVSSAAFTYSLMGTYMITALLLTAMAMFPTVVTLPNFLTRRLRINFVALVPWTLVCCIKFLINSVRHMVVIKRVSEYNNTAPLVLAQFIYCIFFVLSIEMLLHWIAIGHLKMDGVQVVVRRHL